MTTWLVSKTGSNANGGTSPTVLATGTDGIVSTAGGTTKITSISATWTSALVGQGIYASSSTILRLISAVQVAQSVATAVTTNTLTTLTSAGLFNSTMLGCAVSGPGIAAGTYISAYTNSSSMTLSAAAGAGAGSGALVIGPLATTTGTTAFTAATGQTWNVGGAILTFARAMVTASGIHNTYSAGDSIYVGAGVYRETVANTLSGAVTASGTNGVTSTGGTTFTDSTANGFTSGMVGRNIEIVVGGSTYLCTITAHTSSSVVTIAPATAMGFPATAFSSCSWQVGKIAIIADVDGAVTSDAGQVTLSAYTTSDTAAPSGTTTLALAATHDLSFSLITFIGGAGGAVSNSAPAVVANHTFTDCTINAAVSTAVPFSFTSSTTGLALGITIDRCAMMSGNGNGINITLATTASGSADYDALVVLRDCLVISLFSSRGISIAASGTNAFAGGGVRVYGCSILAGTCFIAGTATHLSTTVQCEIHNCLLVGSTGISAATAGQIIGSYNVIYGATPESNYTYGTGDVSNSAGTGTYAAPLLELGQSWKWAGVIRQFLAPDGATSPLVGAGSATFSGNYPTVDWANRPRPTVKAVAAVGYMEVHDFSVQDTVTYPTGQTSSAKMTGPGDTDIWVPVDAVATVLAIQLYQGSGYTGTTYATATILTQNELGVATQAETCTSATGSWQTLTFSSITPTKAGYVKIRVASYDTSGTGTLFFGALTAT